MPVCGNSEWITHQPRGQHDEKRLMLISAIALTLYRTGLPGMDLPKTVLEAEDAAKPNGRRRYVKREVYSPAIL
jgi:hypothetical protein